MLQQRTEQRDEQPCCVCGDWFPYNELTDVSGMPVAKEARRFLNTTLDTRFLCRSFECERKHSGRWGASQTGDGPSHDALASSAAIRRNFFQPRTAAKDSANIKNKRKGGDKDTDTTTSAGPSKKPTPSSSTTTSSKTMKKKPAAPLPRGTLLLTSFLKLTGGASKQGSPGTDDPSCSAGGCADGPAQIAPDAPSSKTPGRTPE